ncbi:MAG: hypothetical protein LCI00_04235 [Chloroflexi bacterium]|nr:hypothetical protein [Chloroflexota bacterium]MCC6894062.1 hypothetical protein [Anaerolineae bacterium]
MFGPIQNDITFSDNRVTPNGKIVTLADIAAASGYSVEEIRAINPSLAGLSINQSFPLFNTVYLPGNPRPVTQLPPGAYIPGSQVTPPPVNGVVPEPYLIRTEDDLLRWMWVNEWGYAANDYDKSKAESRFKDFVEDKVQGMFTQLLSQETSVLPNSGSAEVNNLFNQLMAVEGQGFYFEQLSAMLDGLTLDQLMALRNEAEKAGQGNQGNYAFAPDEFLEYYDAIQALEQGEELPYETHDDYDPQLALHDYFDRHFRSRNPDDIERELIDLALAQIVMLHEGIEAVTDDKLYDAFRDELFQRLGTKSPTIEQLIACLEELIDERVADDQSVEANYDELSIELPHVYDITVQYHDALALDKLRQIAYDPTWNPGEETRQLAELYVAIKQMTRTIMGVDVGFLQSSLFQFHDAVKDAHEWRLNLKASLDHIETQMLERRDEQSEPLWWLLEIPLSILVEPLDWLFTMRDLMLGDWSALIGFLPLVPGALRHIADAGRYLRGASDELVDALRNLPRVDENWINGVTGARNVDDFAENPSRDAYYAVGYPSYNEITNRNEADIIAAISYNNPDIPEDVIKRVYKHVFTEKHEIYIDDGFVTAYFSPDPAIGYLWLKAMGEDELAKELLNKGRDMAFRLGPEYAYMARNLYDDVLSQTDQLYFNRLLSHEYIEAELMNAGYKYNFPRNINAHELSTVQDPMSSKNPFVSLVNNGFISTDELDKLFSNWLTPLELNGVKTWKFEFDNMDELISIILTKVTK